MKFFAIQLSGGYSETQVFRQNLLTLSQIHGERQPRNADATSRYATSRNTDPYIADVNTVLAYLHDLYRSRCLCSCLCDPRCALSVSSQLKGS